MNEAKPQKPLGFGSVAWRIFVAPWPSSVIYVLYDTAKEGMDWQDLVGAFGVMLFISTVFGVIALIFGSALWVLYQGFRITSPIAYAAGAASIPTAFFLILIGRAVRSGVARPRWTACAPNAGGGCSPRT